MTKLRTTLSRGHMCSVIALAVCFGLSVPTRASAEDVDYPKLFLTHVLKCLHPTVREGTATAEVVKGPTKEGDQMTTRVKAFYHGLLSKNSMEVEVLVRQAGSIREMKVNVLADSATEVAHCKLTKEWTDF